MSLQSKVIESIISERNDDVPLVHEIADLLSISLDSAYRRLRGSTELTATELEKLCKRYSISLDRIMMSPKNDSINFNLHGYDLGNFNYQDYLQNLLLYTQKVESAPAPRVFYDAKDIPVFYHFPFPEIAEFKGFFWEKTIYHNSEARKKKFSCRELNTKNIDLGNKIFQLFAKIPTIELWNDEILYSLLNQIKYYHESGFMNSPDDTKLLLEKVLSLVDHIELQAEEGCKKTPQGNCLTNDLNFQLYYNEIVIGYNSVLLEYDGKKEFHIGHNTVNTLVCTDQDFCEMTYHQKMKMLSSSTLISTYSGKERTKFFNRLRCRVNSMAVDLGF